MACSSCGKKLSMANFGATAQGQTVNLRAQQAYWEADPSKWVEVTFQGAIGNHFIASPTRKVRHYGYGGRGAVFMAHIDDVFDSPGTFVPNTLDGALAVWPQYPAGAPAHVVQALGLPKKAEPVSDAPATDTSSVVADIVEPAVDAAAPAKKKKG